MHHRSTMRIGTDAVMLGAWVSCSDASQILDIGSGSGILSLMMAQRNPSADITAVDIDAASSEEAEFNFAMSRWGRRMEAVCADIRQFAKQHQSTFDLIISNPPFFTSAFKTRQAQRNLARHTDTLSYQDLASSAASLLEKNGTFAVVLPENSFETMVEAASAHGLFIKRLQYIIPVEGLPCNRINAEFCFKISLQPNTEQLIIRNKDYTFSAEFQELLKDFYLGLATS